MLADPKGFVEPVIHPCERHSAGPNLAMGSRAFALSEAHVGLWAREVVKKLLRLHLEKHVAFGFANESRTRDSFCDAVAQIVGLRRGQIALGVGAPMVYMPCVMPQAAVGDAFIAASII